jgi:hypothetical protein
MPQFCSECGCHTFNYDEYFKHLPELSDLLRRLRPCRGFRRVPEGYGQYFTSNHQGRQHRLGGVWTNPLTS